VLSTKELIKAGKKKDRFDKYWFSYFEGI